jgi:hypothetical protein
MLAETNVCLHKKWALKLSNLKESWNVSTISREYLHYWIINTNIHSTVIELTCTDKQTEGGRTDSVKFIYFCIR